MITDLRNVIEKLSASRFTTDIDKLSTQYDISTRKILIAQLMTVLDRLISRLNVREQSLYTNREEFADIGPYTYSDELFNKFEMLGSSWKLPDGIDTLHYRILINKNCVIYPVMPSPLTGTVTIERPVLWKSLPMAVDFDDIIVYNFTQMPNLSVQFQSGTMYVFIPFVMKTYTGFMVRSTDIDYVKF